MPKCTLIVNVYNQAKQLDVLLESALKQTNQEFEIVVADDGSSDETETIVAKWTSKLAIKRVWHEDRGFYRTIILNTAAKSANSDYLIFVDGDMILHHRFIEMHLKHAHPQRVMCGWRGCKIRQDIAEQIIRKEITFSTRTASVLWRGLKGEVIKPFRTTIIENKWLRKIMCKERHHVGGCNFAMHKKNYELCNGMDETILQYGYEDHEIGRRLDNNGIKAVGIRNCANTYHLEHGKSENPGIKDVLTRIYANEHKQCKFGLKTLEDGSTNEMFFPK
ncbi:glycosyltransferase [Coraliomargarita sp. SDUM461004]|uniref:Glycosyltransferase n=1 Tax=Thalassobacterium sedimentorum TaxID=3041258 RepID=A0ABU1AJZ9_9BACT|nr:glycosyltransferase [Coraliomargarita sp. SDUM461004]MDQ8195146.1 glycosyltransferase [Coraliomargarita sp. SDUM461004]